MVIKKYNCGDIEALLNCKCPELQDKAGPLLNSIMQGIDAAGGCLYEFKENNSRTRSTRFMKEKMGFDKKLAGYIYSSVRCGMFHEGVTKTGVRFSRRSPNNETGIWESNGKLEICVGSLGPYYLKCIGAIKSGDIKYVPSYSGVCTPPVSDFGQACGCHAPATAVGDLIQRQVGGPNAVERAPSTSSCTPFP